MSRVVLNDVLRTMLGDVSCPFHIFDESGQMVLYVTPVQHASLYEGEDTHLSEEEIARRIAEGGRSLRDFLVELQAKQS